MDKIKCLIVDDEAVARRILENYLADLPEFELAGKCKNALEAHTFLQEHPVELMFLDIEMPRLKGLSFLKTLSHPPEVIITTAHREYALEGFDLDDPELPQGWTNFYRRDDVSATAYFYLGQATSMLPPLAGLGNRTSQLKNEE